jgi:hypothetical protein
VWCGREELPNRLVSGRLPFKGHAARYYRDRSLGKEATGAMYKRRRPPLPGSRVVARVVCTSRRRLSCRSGLVRQCLKFPRSTSHPRQHRMFPLWRSESRYLAALQRLCDRNAAPIRCSPPVASPLPRRPNTAARSEGQRGVVREPLGYLDVRSTVSVMRPPRRLMMVVLTSKHSRRVFGWRETWFPGLDSQTHDGTGSMGEPIL